MGMIGCVKFISIQKLYPPVYCGTLYIERALQVQHHKQDPAHYLRDPAHEEGFCSLWNMNIWDKVMTMISATKYGVNLHFRIIGVALCRIVLVSLDVREEV